jgi:hypothetical protein
MTYRRTLPPVALLAVAALVVGCTRGQTRRDLARGFPPLPSQPVRELAHPSQVAAPVPPTPPPAPPPPVEPPVAPPRADALTGIIPPMPNGGPALLEAPALPGGLPLTVPDSPVVHAEGAADPDADFDRKKRQERREERKERREERKEQRTNPPPPGPPAPAPRPVPVDPPAPAPAPAAAGDDLAAVRKLVDAAARRYADIPDFEARLVKQEVVKGRQLPKDEVEYRFRQKPLSVYMKVLSEAGQGREVMYVQGQFGNQIHLITGKGDNRLVGVGFKTSMDPDDSRATEKSRYRIYEVGFGRTLTGLAKQLDAAEGGRAAVKPLGPVKRPEYPYPLEGVEVVLRPGDDPLLPRGGTRQVYFDPKPDSPSYLFPVLVITTEDGREVEYYCFDRFKAPAGTTDADWNPARLGKK